MSNDQIISRIGQYVAIQDIEDEEQQWIETTNVTKQAYYSGDFPQVHSLIKVDLIMDLDLAQRFLFIPDVSVLSLAHV